MNKIIQIGKRIATAATALFLSTGIVLAVAPSVHAATLTAAPRISFTFDDGMANAYTLAAPALKNYGYTGTSYVVSGCAGLTTAPNACAANPGVAYMTWEQVKDLHDTYGWEIGSHTVTHPLLASSSPALTAAQVDYELSQSKADIAANAGITPTAFAFPYGDYQSSGNPAVAQVAKYYTSARGFQDTGYNIFPYNDYLLVDQMIQGNVSVAMAEKYIDQAVASNSWLILTFHDIVASGASANESDYQYNVADLGAIAAYAQSKGVANTNISDGLVGGTNLLSNFTFDAPIMSWTNTVADANNWTTDSTADITVDANNNGSTPSAQNSAKIASNASKNEHLFSPSVGVTPGTKYVIKSFVNILQIASAGELAFYIDEYDANGAYVATQYMGSRKAAPNPLLREYGFEYTPSVAAAWARVQVAAIANSGLIVYIDNVRWFSENGAPIVVAKPGDVNGDGAINDSDLSVLLYNWYTTGKANLTAAQGDISGSDGIVNDSDLSVLLYNWTK